MSRFRIDHPTDPKLHAIAGVDHAIGPFFVEVVRDGRSRPVKSLDMFTLGRPVTLQDCFEFLIEHEFITRDALEDALVFLQDGGRKPRSEGVKRVVRIVMGMKRAADCDSSP